MEWLVRVKEAALNPKDAESGYTALHRAIYSGQERKHRKVRRHFKFSWAIFQDISFVTILRHSLMNLPQIHVAEYLLDRGANSALADHEGLTAFDLALMDKQTTLDLNPLSSPSEVYAWGANANFNLGIRDVIQHR